jgi:hypothetical protein
MRMKCNRLLPMLAGMIVFFGCGGSSEQGNARTFITGNVSFDNDSVPVGHRNAFVQLVDENYIPYLNDRSLIHTRISDDSGRYSFQDIPAGIYYLNAWDTVTGFRAIEGPFDIHNEDRQLPEVLLQKNRRIQATIPDTLSSSFKSLYIKGTTLHAVDIDSASFTAIMDTVPAGEVTLMGTTIRSTDHTQNISLSKGTVFSNVNTLQSTDTITVTYDNAPPLLLASADMMQGTFYYNQLYLDSVQATDPDGDVLYYSIINAPAGLMIDSLSGIITWIPADTVTSFEIGIKVADMHGSSVQLWWTIRDGDVKNRPATPSPPAIITAGNLYFPGEFSARPVCADATRYRFVFTDGDTTQWSADSMVSHAWDLPGVHGVRVQVMCDTNTVPSFWSTETEVALQYDTALTPPAPAVSDTLVLSGDTLIFYCRYKPCESDSVTFYQFYVNGIVTRTWSTDSTYEFAPETLGTYGIQVAVTCSSDSLRSSGLSEPVHIHVEEGGNALLLPPSPEGDSVLVYSDTVLFRYRISDTGICSASVPQYRFSFTGFSDSTETTDTTDWSADTTIYFTRYFPSGTYAARVQMICIDSTGSIFSGWSNYFYTTIVPLSKK